MSVGDYGEKFSQRIHLRLTINSPAAGLIVLCTSVSEALAIIPSVFRHLDAIGMVATRAPKALGIDMLRMVTKPEYSPHQANKIVQSPPHLLSRNGN